MLQPTVTYDLYHIYTITDVCFTLCGTDSLWFHGVSASVHTARSTQRRFFFPSSVWKNSTGLQRTMTSTPSNHGRINLLEGPRGRKLPLSLHWSLHPSISRPVCAADALSALDFFIFFPVSVCDWIKISIFFKYKPDNHAGWGSWVLYHPASVTRGYTDTKKIL